MSTAIKLYVSDEVTARLDCARGLHSRQEFIVNAIIAALDGSCVEQALRAEIERLHQTLRSSPTVSLPTESVLSWD